MNIDNNANNNNISYPETGSTQVTSTSMFEQGVHLVKQGLAARGEAMSIWKEHFLQQLASALPHTTNPCVQSVDGSMVDVIWEDVLTLTLTDEDTACVVDWSTGEQDFRYFTRNEVDDAVQCFVSHCLSYQQA